MNIFDVESARMTAARKAAKQTQRIVQRFHRPEIESDVGEAWQSIKADTAVFDYFRAHKPEAVKQMEARYGQG